MLFTVARRALAGGYDAIHSHEEMGLVGVWLARWLGIPHLYDMHSSLPQQLGNFKFSGSRLLRRIFDGAERRMVQRIRRRHHHLPGAAGHRDRDGPRPARHPHRERHGRRRRRSADADARPRSAQRWGVPAEAPIVLYTGTFEAYQGLELLIEAAARLQASHPAARVLVVGGSADAGRGGRGAVPRRWAAATSSSPASSRRARSRRSSPPATSWPRRGSAAPTRRSRSTRICARACRSSRPTC